LQKIVNDNEISQKKISRNIGILAKMRYYVPQNILKQLYYCLIYPYLTYGILVWGNAYENSIKNVVILQKKVIRIINFSEYNSHTSELFKKLELMKFKDIVFLQYALFMYQFHHKIIPAVFEEFFTPTSEVHKYSTVKSHFICIISDLIMVNLTLGFLVLKFGTVFLIIIKFLVYPASNTQSYVTFFPTINCIFIVLYSI
jgi:hypothetical protein